jgi:hypothetical protein
MTTTRKETVSSRVKKITKLINRKPSETSRVAKAAASKAKSNAPKHPTRPK